MSPTLETLAAYLLRVAPGLCLGALTLLLLRREPRGRIVSYLALFILLRDAMTPLGLWRFGSEGVFWIRLHDDPWFLVLFGASCLGLSLALYYFDRDNRPLVHWRRGALPLGLLLGLGGALAVVAPFLLLYQDVPIEARGGAVSTDLLPATLAFAMLGNLLEETLFRGYVLGLLEERFKPVSAALASGLVFAFCHIFLATTVSNAGYPLLLFTLWEGCIAGLVGARSGVLASTTTHGGAIFLLSSGLF